MSNGTANTGAGSGGGGGSGVAQGAPSFVPLSVPHISLQQSAPPDGTTQQQPSIAPQVQGLRPPMTGHIVAGPTTSTRNDSFDYGGNSSLLKETKDRYNWHTVVDGISKSQFSPVIGFEVDEGPRSRPRVSYGRVWVITRVFVARDYRQGHGVHYSTAHGYYL